MENKELEMVFMNKMVGGRLTKVYTVKQNCCSVNGIGYYMPYYVRVAQDSKKVIFGINKIDESGIIRMVNYMGAEDFLDTVIYLNSVGVMSNKHTFNKCCSVVAKLSDIKPSAEYIREIGFVTEGEHVVGEEVRRAVRRAQHENVRFAYGECEFSVRGIPVEDIRFKSIICSIYRHSNDIGIKISSDFGVNRLRTFGKSVVRIAEIQSNIDLMKKVISSDDILYLIKCNLAIGNIKSKDVSKILSCEI